MGLEISSETYRSGAELGSEFVIRYSFCPNRNFFAKAGNLLAKAVADLSKELDKDHLALIGLSPEGAELPSPTGPVILEQIGTVTAMRETDEAVQASLAANPGDIERLEEILGMRREGLFVKPSEPAKPKDLHCEVPELPHTILCKPDQIENAVQILQANAPTGIEIRVAEPSQVEHDVGPEPEEPEPSEKDKLATAFELDCFEKVNSPETAAKLWEEYKERVSAYGDAYRKMRATSLVMAVVDHNEGLTVPEAGTLIQAEVKKLNAKPAEKAPENVQPEAPEDITPLVEKFIEALKEFDNKPNVSESELFRLLAVTCASPMPDRKVNPTKAFAVLDGATTLHKSPLLVKTFPDMAATKEKILGDASKTKKFSMMCAAAKIQIEK